MNWELGYLSLVQRVIDEGYLAESRAGATHSVPGAMLKVPLDQGFPLLTTRKMYPAGVIGELAGFVRGAEDLKTYEDFGCNYWGENAGAWRVNEDKPREEWQIGRAYGAQWVDWRPPRKRVQPLPCLAEGIQATRLGIANGAYSAAEPYLRRTWNNMLSRCYDPTCEKYELYGARGVYVANAWLEFKVFSKDVKQLPGWVPDLANAGLQLDKDTIGDGFCYSKDTCQWLTAKENHYGRKVLYTVEKSGVQYTFSNTSAFCEEHNCEPSQFSRMLNKVKYRHTSNGFSLVDARVISEGNKRSVNQIAGVIDGLKKDPLGRRHIVTAWNPAELDLGVLPPCHVMFQFYVREGGLHCMVYMRSVDLCVGLPSDIVLYALLTALVAKDTCLRPASLTFFFGDCHVYHNHVNEFLTKQAIRPIQKSPTLVLAEEATTLTFTPSMVEIKDYRHCEAIKYQFNA